MPPPTSAEGAPVIDGPAGATAAAETKPSAEGDSAASTAETKPIAEGDGVASTDEPIASGDESAPAGENGVEPPAATSDDASGANPVAENNA